MRIHGSCVRGGVAALAALILALPAHAVSIEECSAHYKAAKEAGTLQGMSWNEFRKAGCEAPSAGKPSTWSGNVVFPKSVSRKYANEAAGRARMHTCLDQYKANKVANRNGSLKWAEKGGGYYSECNKRLSQQ
jgi:hypothetical protein